MSFEPTAKDKRAWQYAMGIGQVTRPAERGAAVLADFALRALAAVMEAEFYNAHERNNKSYCRTCLDLYEYGFFTGKEHRCHSYTSAEWLEAARERLSK